MTRYEGEEAKVMNFLFYLHNQYLREIEKEVTGNRGEDPFGASQRAAIGDSLLGRLAEVMLSEMSPFTQIEILNSKVKALDTEIRAIEDEAAKTFGAVGLDVSREVKRIEGEIRDLQRRILDFELKRPEKTS